MKILPIIFACFVVILWNTSCQKDNQTLSLADTLNLDTTQCNRCFRIGKLSTKDSLACETKCGITHFNPGNMGFISVPEFGIEGAGPDVSLSLTLRPDGHSYRFAISGSQSNSYYHTTNSFSFEIDSVEGVGRYVLDTLKPGHGLVSAQQITLLGTTNWNMVGGKLTLSGTDCISLGFLNSNHVLTITQWGSVGAVIKGKVTGQLFSFPSSCTNWNKEEYVCNFALTRQN